MRTTVKQIDQEASRILKIKIKICESEASETQYWLEVIVETKWLSRDEIKLEYNECSELLALFTSIGKNK